MIFGIAFAFFKIQNALTKGGIRTDEEDEIAGLDLPEMGVLAYPEFVYDSETFGGNGGSVTAPDEGACVEGAPLPRSSQGSPADRGLPGSLAVTTTLTIEDHLRP